MVSIKVDRSMRREFQTVLMQIDRHADLILQFVTVFSRFEFALMREGYIRKDKVEAAWYRFGAGLPMNLVEGNIPQISQAISYLYEEPPMRLIRTPKNGVAWTSQKRRKRNNEGLFQLVKDVRNNLLHGGKVPFRPDRDVKLLQSALDILSFTLGLDEGVRDAFLNEFMWAAA